MMFLLNYHHYFPLNKLDIKPFYYLYILKLLQPFNHQTKMNLRANGYIIVHYQYQSLKLKCLKY